MMPDEVLEMGAEDEYTELQEKYDKLKDALSEIYSLADVIHPDSDQICGYIDSILLTPEEMEEL